MAAAAAKVVAQQVRRLDGMTDSQARAQCLQSKAVFARRRCGKAAVVQRKWESLARPSHDSAELFADAGFLLTRSFLWFLLCAFTVLAGSAAVMAWYFRMDVSVEGSGVLTPAMRHKIKPATSGVVGAVHVEQGAFVHSGDRLLSLDDTQWRSQLKNIEREITIVSSRARRLAARLLSDRRIAEDALRVAQVEVERAAFEVSQAQVEHSVKHEVAGKLLGWRRNAVDDLIPVRRVQGVLDQKRALRSLAAAHKSANDGRERELEELHEELGKLDEERQRFRRKIEQAVLRSPMDGVVLTAKLQERLGDRVEAGESVVEVADAQSWVVEAGITEADIARVRIGHRARIEISAFPHMQYELLNGEVVRIGGRATAAGYPVRVKLPRGKTINDLERAYEFFEGMTATVRITVDHGRILSLLWREVLRGFGRLTPDGLRWPPAEAG
jgi:multidrug resistance efflux pump